LLEFFGTKAKNRDLLARSVLCFLSYKGRTADALGQRADEGRGKRRNVTGSCNQALIREYPNGVTH